MSDGACCLSFHLLTAFLASFCSCSNRSLIAALEFLLPPSFGPFRTSSFRGAGLPGGAAGLLLRCL